MTVEISVFKDAGGKDKILCVNGMNPEQCNFLKDLLKLQNVQVTLIPTTSPSIVNATIDMGDNSKGIETLVREAFAAQEKSISTPEGGKDEQEPEEVLEKGTVEEKEPKKPKIFSTLPPLTTDDIKVKEVKGEKNKFTVTLVAQSSVLLWSEKAGLVTTRLSRDGIKRKETYNKDNSSVWDVWVKEESFFQKKGERQSKADFLKAHLMGGKKILSGKRKDFSDFTFTMVDGVCMIQTVAEKTRLPVDQGFFAAFILSDPLLFLRCRQFGCGTKEANIIFDTKMQNLPPLPLSDAEAFKNALKMRLYNEQTSLLKPEIAPWISLTETESVQPNTRKLTFRIADTVDKTLYPAIINTLSARLEARGDVSSLSSQEGRLHFTLTGISDLLPALKETILVEGIEVYGGLLSVPGQQQQPVPPPPVIPYQPGGNLPYL